MSNHSRDRAAARITPVSARERALALSTATEKYVAHSPSLAADAVATDDRHAVTYYSAIVAKRPQGARAAWLLVVWLGVSAATIAAAAGVVANYF
jgi:DNA-directed RNA polymerase specialized sigma24 family protein